MYANEKTITIPIFGLDIMFLFPTVDVVDFTEEEEELLPPPPPPNDPSDEASSSFATNADSTGLTSDHFLNAGVASGLGPRDGSQLRASNFENPTTSLSHASKPHKRSHFVHFTSSVSSDQNPSDDQQNVTISSQGSAFGAKTAEAATCAAEQIWQRNRSTAKISDKRQRKKKFARPDAVTTSPIFVPPDADDEDDEEHEIGEPTTPPPIFGEDEESPSGEQQTDGTGAVRTGHVEPEGGIRASNGGGVVENLEILSTEEVPPKQMAIVSTPPSVMQPTSPSVKDRTSLFGQAHQKTASRRSLKNVSVICESDGCSMRSLSGESFCRRHLSSYSSSSTRPNKARTNSATRNKIGETERTRYA